MCFTIKYNKSWFQNDINKKKLKIKLKIKSQVSYVNYSMQESFYPAILKDNCIQNKNTEIRFLVTDETNWTRFSMPQIQD